MIKCPSCDFEVSNKMRHALSKNSCPSCGSALLGNFHIQRMNFIKEKILLQDFSKSLDQSIIFDLSLFILSEFYTSKPQRERITDDVIDKKSFDSTDNDSIRDEVRREVMASSALDEQEVLGPDSDISEDELAMLNASRPLNNDIDLKTAKLKRIYSDSPILKKSGVSVRRVT